MASVEMVGILRLGNNQRNFKEISQSKNVHVFISVLNIHFQWGGGRGTVTNNVDSCILSMF